MVDEAPNKICKDCLIWKQFGRKCHYFWEGKKECTMKVYTPEEFEEEKLRTKDSKSKRKKE